MTSDDDRRTLLELARTAIVAHVAGLPPPQPLTQAPFARRAGVFVSLHERGELRGCIGHIEADVTLGEVVAHCARRACSEDPRFRAVGEADLSLLQIEISILGPLESIASPEDVEIGRHGVVVEQGRHRGLLLPQVATESQWTARMLVEQTCRKAGLPHDAWRRGARLFRFDAEIFSDR